MRTKVGKAVAAGLTAAFAASAALVAPVAAQQSQDRIVVSGMVEWGIFVDRDGCMHWWADGGLEGYMTTRFNPETGRPLCLQKESCLTESTDTLFHTDSHHLKPGQREELERFFRSEGAFSYAVYGHTDERASHAYNQALSERRAGTVASVARSVGAFIEVEEGFGETRPVATGHNETAWQQNRRVEVVCFHMPR
jgi:outer membrane protein OmpA-like peptidoglycan-associated protein